MGYYLTEIEGMVFLQLFNSLFLQLPIVRVEDALPVMDTGTIQPSAGLDTDHSPQSSRTHASSTRSSHAVNYHPSGCLDPMLLNFNFLIGTGVSNMTGFRNSTT